MDHLQRQMNPLLKTWFRDTDDATDRPKEGMSLLLIQLRSLGGVGRPFQQVKKKGGTGMSFYCG